MVISGGNREASKSTDLTDVEAARAPLRHLRGCQPVDGEHPD